MTNQEKYRFKDFTFKNYHKTILEAKNIGFKFIFFYEKFGRDTRQLLWRHDVEFSPFIALKMAEIEAEEGVKATYFFQLHGECYNILEKEIYEIVLKIKAYGHDIGLHFDTHFFNVNNEEELEKFLKIDARYFNEIFQTKIKAFSFHNTNTFILSCRKRQYAGIINVYSKEIMDSFKYCADSTGYWRYENLSDLLKKPGIQKLQVLTHDAMWSEDTLPPRQRIFNSIDQNALRIKQWYDSTLSKFGAMNIDWDEVL